jgi:hypothetical protein
MIFLTPLAITATPLVSASPCYLSYYNEFTTLILGGADRVGLEIDYWGEGITRRLLERAAKEVPEGEAVAIVPTLHQFQAEDYYRQSPILRLHRVRTVEFNDKPSLPKYVLAYRRLADLPQKFELTPDATDWTVIETHHEAFFARRNKEQ